MHYQNEHEQAKCLEREHHNMFEEQHKPSYSKLKTTHVRFQGIPEEKEGGHDICGKLELIKGISPCVLSHLHLTRCTYEVLKLGRLVNAKYIFMSSAKKHFKIHGTSNANDIFDVVVQKIDGEYRAVLFGQGSRVASLVGFDEATIDAALTSLLEISCEKVSESITPPVTGEGE